MFVRRLDDCEQIVAGDKSLLRELVHPDKDNVALRYSLAHAVVPPGRATVPHRLKNCEVYYILVGKGLMHIEQEASAVETGAVVYIPPGATQWIENTGGDDLQFLCIVDPAWQEGDEAVLGDQEADSGG